MSTSAEIKSAIEIARDIVAGMELPTSFQTIAFEVVLTHLVSTGHKAANRQPQVPHSISGYMHTSAANAIEQIATRLGIGAEAAKSLFRVQDDELSLVVSARRFASQVASATREIALLVIGGRQASGLDEWTSVAAVRDECKRLGRLDTANFAATLARLDDEFSFSGTGAKREVRLTAKGWKSWEDLARSLVGDD